jgi:nitrogen fixation protein FixH
MLSRILGTRTFTGWHMAGVIALFFGTVITANATLAVMASRSWTGLVVSNSFVASAHFDEETAARVQGAAAGWRLATRYESGRFVVTVTDADGPIRDLKVTGRLGRPSHEREDRELVFARRGEAYVAPAELGPGVWTGEIAVRHPGASLAAALRFRVAR